MARVLINESNLQNIADAIRAKNGSSDTYTPSQMAGAISAISTGLDIKKLTATVASDQTSTYTMLTDPQLLKARTAGQTLRVYGRNSRGSSYYVCAPTLVIVEA